VVVHLNPAISLSFMVTRRITLLRCLSYIFVQLIGAILGALIVFGINSERIARKIPDLD